MKNPLIHIMNVIINLPTTKYANLFMVKESGFYFYSYEGLYMTAFLHSNKVYATNFPTNTVYKFSLVKDLYPETIAKIDSGKLKYVNLGIQEMDIEVSPCRVRYFNQFNWEVKAVSAIWGLDKARPNRIGFVGGLRDQDFTDEEMEALSNGFGVVKPDTQSSHYREFWM